jgi:hypothetical protein
MMPFARAAGASCSGEVRGLGNSQFISYSEEAQVRGAAVGSDGDHCPGACPETLPNMG